MSPSLTDWIGSANSSGFIVARTGLYVRLVNQITGSAYVSASATNANGTWTITSRPPAGNYEMYTGPSATGPWTDTGYAYEVTPWEQPWIDVLDYGADPTGAADSTTAIQAALDAVPTFGGVVLFRGNFRVEGNLAPADGTVLMGVGFPIQWNDSSSTTRPARLRALTGTTGGMITRTNASANVTIVGIELVGAANSGSIGINITNGSSWTIQDCFIRNFGGPAIQIGAGIGCKLERLLCQGVLNPRLPSVDTGVVDLAGTDHWISQCEIDGSITTANGTGHVIGLLVRTGNIFVTDSVMEYCHKGVVVSGDVGSIGQCHFKGTRSEFNNQNGWQIDNWINHFVGCVSYLNGLLTTNTYDGFVTTGGWNSFVACVDSIPGGWGGALTRYCFTDTSTTANGNYYIGCISGGGGSTGVRNFTNSQQWVGLPQQSTLQTLAGSDTIATANIDVARTTCTAARTGVILQSGTFGGQQVTVVNEGSFTWTFNTNPATSHVANAATATAIPVLTARRYVWDAGTSLWYQVT